MSLRSINGGISFLRLQQDDHDLFLDEFSAVDSFPYWSHHQILNENGVVSRNNQVNFVMDLFHQRVEESNLMGSDEIVSITVNDETFGVIEENGDVGRHHLGLELGLGLLDDDNYEDDFNFGGFAASECGDDFYIARRREKGSKDCDGGSSRVSGARTVWIESDSDDDEVEVEVEGIDNVLLGMNVGSDDDDDDDDDDNEESFCVEAVNTMNDDGELSVTLCWDSLNLEDEVHGEDVEEVNNHHDFEWEEVDDEGVEREEILGFGGDDVEDGNIEVERGGRVSNSNWEVLLNHLYVNDMNRNLGMENVGDGPYYGDHDDYIYTAEYETMFGQFSDGENVILGRPPASKAAIEKLPSVVITEKDVADEKSLCAVCKDLIEVGEEGKTLPCSHLYHGDCILPWLGIRNTCPVCRFELPTDDLEYEQRKTRSSDRII